MKGVRKKGNLYEMRFVKNGKRHSIYAKTLDELKKKRKTFKEKKSDKTVKEFATQFFETYKKPKVSTTTLQIEIRQVEMHLAQILNKELSKVTELELAQLLAEIRGSRTKKQCYSLVKQIFSKATQLGRITANPAQNLEAPKHKKKLGNALSLKEETEFLQKIRGIKLEALFLFMLYTGTRRGEALAFRKSDIQNQYIRIKGTKTESSNRIIPFFENARRVIEEYGITWQEANKDAVTHDFKKYCPTHKLHDLRHTFATRCLEAGISMKTVQIWLGHSTYEQTANTYSHITQEFGLEEAKKLL